jgi:hypothetical protein
MKLPIASKPLNILLFGFLAIFVMFSCTSCSTKAAFLTSSVVPAARGDVQVTRDNNKNYVIQLDIVNLAEPARLQPPKKTYVVWMVTDQKMTKNIGQMESSSGAFSNKLKASFKTSSAFKPTKIFITAEDDANVQYASSVVVLATNNF